MIGGSVNFRETHRLLRILGYSIDEEIVIDPGALEMNI